MVLLGKRLRYLWLRCAWLPQATVGPLLITLLVLIVSTGRAQSGQSTNTQSSKPAQSQAPQDIPDAPSTVQPPPAPSSPADRPPIPPPTEGTNLEQPPTATEAGQTGGETQPPPMPPIQTVPPGTSTAQGSSGQQQLYKLVVQSNFVQVPVTVKDKDGRLAGVLLPNDFL